MHNNLTGTTDNSSMPVVILSVSSQIFLIVAYALTTLLAVLGNVFVVVVFSQGRRCRTDLRPFLINLAISDLIMAVFCLPFSFTSVMLKTWIFSTPMCPIVLFVQLLAVTSSVCTNVAVGVDRYMAVIYPLRSRITNSRYKVVLTVIWLFACGIASPQLYVGRATDRNSGAITISECNEVWPSITHRRVYSFVVLIVTYVVPLCILTVTYSIVGCSLWYRTTPGNADRLRDLHQLNTKRKVVKMLVIVVVMFAACWLPIHVFMLVIDFHPELLDYNNVQDELFFTAVYYCVHWLAMSNSFANPIIYGFTNESFRADLLSLLYRWFPCCKCLPKFLPRKGITSTYLSVDDKRNSTCFVQQQTSNNSNKQFLAMKSANGHKVYFELESKEDNSEKG